MMNMYLSSIRSFPVFRPYRCGKKFRSLPFTVDAKTIRYFPRLSNPGVLQASLRLLPGSHGHT
uniref:Putative mam and ldl-receptor class a domain-containing protein n=1 Tax=Parasteatoda tepidariorum TaxID=114398 RepID=A0A2L2Z780_PARTP